MPSLLLLTTPIPMPMLLLLLTMPMPMPLLLIMPLPPLSCTTAVTPNGSADAAGTMGGWEGAMALGGAPNASTRPSEPKDWQEGTEVEEGAKDIPP